MPRPVKVLAVIPNLNGGGAERGLINLAHSFDRSRVQPIVLAHERVGDLLGSVPADLDVRFIHSTSYRRWHLPHLLAETIRQARNCDVLIGANEGRATALTWVAAKALGRPIVGMINNNWFEFSKVTSWRQRYALNLYARMDRVIACSQGAAEGLAQVVQIDPQAINVIPCAIPTEAIKHQSRHELPPETDRVFEKPTVVNVGRLDYQKGQCDLIEAHGILRRAGVDHNLAIVGRGGLLAPLREHAVRSGVADSVYFMGFQNNPYPFMKRATLMALSSRFEGFGIVIVEAMACGCPVVSFDCPSGPREILQDGRFGVLVRPGDAQGLATEIGALLASPTRRRMLSDLGLRRAEEFSASSVARAWESLLTEVLRRSDGGVAPGRFRSSSRPRCDVAPLSEPSSFPSRYLD